MTPASKLFSFISPCIAVLAVCTQGYAQENETQIDFFESKIRPVLVEHCYNCHSSEAKSVKGGLLLDTKQGVLAGGDSGAAVVPHHPDDSVLLHAIRYEDYEMPPKQKLPDSVIANFEKWIATGAADPRKGTAPSKREIDVEEGRNFWAFQPTAPQSSPDVSDPSWPRNEIDSFILARLDEQGLSPVNDASPTAWLRRVSFDIIGLPPTLEELTRFQAAASEDLQAAKERVVDRLLESQHVGERWGRHWLDLARYAESTGRTRNYPFPFAWRYRDYVIQSFNEDKPYDQFIIEQLAGDQLESDDENQREQQLVATGFLAVGSPDLNERNAKVFEMDMIADQIDTTCRSMLALTVGCARCHDHKFDPIPTDDYYALAGIFKSTQLLNGYAPRGGGGNKARGDLLIKLGAHANESPPSEEEQLTAGLDKNKANRLVKAKQERDQAAARVARVKKNRKLSKKERNRQLAQAKQAVTQKQRQLSQLQNKFRRDRKIKVEGPACLGVRDAKKIVNCNVHIRGEVNRLGDEIPRGFLQVIENTSLGTPPSKTSGRLELARWIASPNNPLTSRVIVNRIWRHMFGQGIVRTVDNFGAMGDEPTHRRLLDYLANDFIQNDWSIKQLIRKLALSRTYGLSATVDESNASIDQNNSLLWRMNSRRLDFEAMRDALLAVSGRLVQSAPTGSYVETLNVNELSTQKTNFKYDDFTHRSVYLPVMRNLIPEAMAYFDFPNGSETRGARDVTTVPTQSLFLMNSPFVVDLANSLAKTLVDEDKIDDSTVQHTYRRVFSRDPTQEETNRVTEYVSERKAEIRVKKPTLKNVDSKKRNKKSKRTVPAKTSKQRDAASPAVIAMSEVIHAMFASAEFRYR